MFLKDRIYLKIIYFLKQGMFLNLSNPKRFTEKIQLYKLKFRNQLVTKCSDKILVRNYIKSLGIDLIIIPLISSFNRIEDICLEDLPQNFIIKLLSWI